MAENTVQIIISGDASSLTETLRRLEAQFRNLAGTAGSAGQGAAAGLGTLETGLKKLAVAVIGPVAGFLTLRAAVRGAYAVIGKADELRDLNLQLETLTGSSAAAQEAMRMFSEHAGRLTVTSTELARGFRNLLPVAEMRGATEEATRNLTVFLAKFAQASGFTFEEVLADYTSLLTGMARGSNVILRRIGESAKDFREGKTSIDEVNTAIVGVAGAADRMGLSLSTAIGKARSDALKAMAEGFNDAARGVDALGTKYRQVFAGEFKDRFHEIGVSLRSIAETAIEWLPAVLKQIHQIVEGFRVFVSIVKVAKAGIEELLTRLEAGLRAFAAFVMGVIAGLGRAVSVIPGLSSAGTQMATWADEQKAILDKQAEDLWAHADELHQFVDKEVAEWRRLNRDAGFGAVRAAGEERFPVAAQGIYQDGKLLGYGAVRAQGPPTPAGFVPTTPPSTLGGVGHMVVPPSGPEKKVKEWVSDYEQARKSLEDLYKNIDLVNKSFGDSYAYVGPYGEALVKLAERFEELGGSISDARRVQVAFAKEEREIALSMELARKATDDSIAALEKLEPPIGDVQSAIALLDEKWSALSGRGYTHAQLLAHLGPEYQKLTGSVDAFGNEIGPLADSVRNINAEFDREEKIKAFADALKQLRSAATAVGESFEALGMAINLDEIFGGPSGTGIDPARLTNLYRSQLEGALGAYRQFGPDIPGLSAEGLQRLMPYLQRIQEMLKIEADEKQIQQAVQHAMTNFTSGVANIFSTLLFGSAKDVGRAMAQAFTQQVQGGFEKLFSALFPGAGGEIGRVVTGGRTTLGGGGTYEVGGQRFYSRSEAERYLASQNRAAGYAQMGLGAVQLGIGAYQGGYAGQSLLAGTVSGAAAGAGLALGGMAAGALAGSAVPIIGTIIGAIVGFAATYFGQKAAQEELQYGVPGIRGGRAYIQEAEEITPAELDKILSDTQGQFDRFWSAYVRILTDLPFDTIIPALTDVDITGRFQGAASTHWAEHLEQWLKGTLPDEVMEEFTQPFQAAFVQLGGTVDRFRQLWTAFDQLDPAATLRAWTNTFQAMRDISETLEYFRTPVGRLGVAPGEFAPDQGLLNREAAAMRQTWTQRMQDPLTGLDTLIEREARAVSVLRVGSEERATAEARLGQLMRQRYEQERQYLQQIVQAMQEIRRSVDAFLLDIDLQQMVTPEGTPDYEAQLARLQQRADELFGRLTTATSPEEVQQLTQEWMANQQQMLGIAQNLGPEQYQRYLQWVEDNTKTFRDEALAKLQEFADQVQEANERLIDAIEALTDAILGGDGGTDRGRGRDNPANQPPPPPRERPGPPDDRLRPNAADSDELVVAYQTIVKQMGAATMELRTLADPERSPIVKASREIGDRLTRGLDFREPTDPSRRTTPRPAAVAGNAAGGHPYEWYRWNSPEERAAWEARWAPSMAWERAYAGAPNARLATSLLDVDKDKVSASRTADATEKIATLLENGRDVRVRLDNHDLQVHLFAPDGWEADVIQRRLYK